MKQLFRQIFGSKTNKEPQKLTAWVLELSDMDDLAALQLCTQKLILLFDSPTLTTNQKLDLIIDLEEVNKQRLEKLSAQYVGLTNIKPELETSIVETCYHYCRQSYIYHLKLIEVIINPLESEHQKENQLLLIARALNAAMHMMKWREFSHESAPAKVWQQIYLLYKIAHKQNLLTTPVETFPLTPASTISAYIVQVCMFGQLKDTTLEKAQIETTISIMRLLITHAHISLQYNPEQYLFYIDLDQDMPAKRIRKIEPKESLRFWELDDFEKQVLIAANMTERGELPESLIRANTNDPDLLFETLSTLHAEWTKQQYIRQRRREPREATSKNAKVKAGIFDICDQVLHANQINNGLTLSKQGKGLEDLFLGEYTLNQTSGLTIDSSSLDTWIITDESKHGLGARVNKYANTLARPKKLIALVFDDDPTKTCIGMIRAVKATQGNQLRVGIEVISNLAVWSQVKPNYEDNSFADSISKASMTTRDSVMKTNLFPAIYLPKEQGISDQASMIMPKVNYSPKVEYVVYVGGKTKRVQLADPIDANDDWVKVTVAF